MHESKWRNNRAPERFFALEEEIFSYYSGAVLSGGNQMKNAIVTSVFSLMVLAIALPMSAASQWHNGKNLQGAFVGQWKMATYTSKLATAAAWISFQPKIKDKAIYARMIQNLRPQTFQLVQCVDRSAADEDYNSRTNVDDLAERCLFLLEW